MSNIGEYTKLTKDGENFIRSKCSSAGNSLLSGKNSYVLPGCIPPVPTSKIWTSNSQINEGITTNQELCDAIIKTLNTFGQDYQIDTNFLGAQIFGESGYKAWNYSPSGAMGITQFIPSTIYEYGIKQSSKYDNATGIIITPEETNALIIGIPENVNRLQQTYTNKNTLSPYRQILFQNVVDNPMLMIKLQFRYMKYIAVKFNSLASHALFGYNRGEGTLDKTYPLSIEKAKRLKPDYEVEGVKYVYGIFKLLHNSFGRKDLAMNIPTSQFDAFKANVDETNK